MAKDSESADLKQAIEKLTLALQEQNKKVSSLKDDINSLEEDDQNSFGDRVMSNLQRRDPMLGALIGGVGSLIKQRAASKAEAKANQAGKITPLTKTTSSADIISSDTKVASTPESVMQTNATSKIATSLDKTLTRFSKSMDKTLVKFAKALDKTLAKGKATKTTAAGKSSGPGSISEEIRNASKPKSSVSSSENLKKMVEERTRPTSESPTGRIGEIARKAEGIGTEGAAAAEGAAATEGGGLAATLMRSGAAAEGGGIASTLMRGGLGAGAAASIPAILGGAAAAGAGIIASSQLPQSDASRGYGYEPGSSPVKPIAPVTTGGMTPGQKRSGMGGMAPDNRMIGGAPESPAPVAPMEGIGALSAKYESRGNVATISSGKGAGGAADPGGKSYGTYQLASKTGTMQAFLKSEQGKAFADQYGLNPSQVGTPEFDAAYKAASQADPAGFAKAQEDYITETHYKPVEAAAKAAGIDTSNPAVQQALFSQSVQHGLKGNKAIISSATASLKPGASPEEQISALYSSRGSYVEGLSSLTPEQKAKEKKRYGSEQADALAALAATPQTAAMMQTAAASPQTAASASPQTQVSTPVSEIAPTITPAVSQTQTASITPVEPAKSGDRIDQTSSQVASGDQAAMAAQIAMATGGGAGGGGGPTIINAGGGGGGGSPESPTIAPNPTSRGSLDQYAVFNPYNDTI